jgi:hypothetical protein
MIDRIHHFVAITGRATDEVTGKPVAAARVNLVSEGKFLVRRDQQVTGPDGFFYFMDLPNGEYRIQVSAPGAPPASAKVQVTRALDKFTRPATADVTLKLTERPKSPEAPSAKAKSDKRPKRPDGG